MLNKYPAIIDKSFILGFRFQVSGVREQRSDDRKQIEKIGRYGPLPAFCILLSVFCILTPET
jgi:hypothetical protein